MRWLIVLGLIAATIGGCGGSGAQPPVVGAREQALHVGQRVYDLCHGQRLAGARIDALTGAVRLVDQLQNRYPDDDRVQRLTGAALTIAQDDCPAGP